MAAGADVAWDPPGPGQWALDRSHFPGGATRIVQHALERTMETAMRRVFAELGTPADTVQTRFVNGFMYTRLRPLIGADATKPRPLPPTPILKLVTRLHPAFRARVKAAAYSEVNDTWRPVNERWHRELRPRAVARNLEFQRTDLAALTDVAMDRHVSALLDYMHESLDLHFWLHGYDLGPIARYLHQCLGWGVTADEATSALVGASPSTAAPVRRLVALRRVVEDAGVDPQSLDDIRRVSSEAAALLDDHLEQVGSCVVTGYDIDSFTLNELPGLLLAGIRDATEPTDTDHAAIADRLRAKIPPASRTEFDQRLADARAVMDLRDDNGPTTVEWPTGLLRGALLEVGRRLVARGALHEADHALELTDDEARRACTTPVAPAAAMAERAAARAAQRRLDPPALLGTAEPTPSPDVLPKPLPDNIRIVSTAIEHLGMAGTQVSQDPLVGAGIGTESYVGRARRADSADEAMAAMEPGDVLIVRATSPAFNNVLFIAGAVVTADGGALSHAAVLSRELGIPAVVGAPGALSIPDGATVEVDPAAGRVTIVTTR